MLSCLGQFYWRDLLLRVLARLLDAALVRVMISAAVAMCLCVLMAKSMTRKVQKGWGVIGVR
jgi:hypothetical protein